MKFKRFFAALAVISACGVALAGCGGNEDVITLQGEYGYVQYGTPYGVKVSVDVENSSVGYKIKKITVVPDAESGYVLMTPAEYGYDGSGWNSGVNALLDTYCGRTVQSVLALTVTVEDSVPSAIDNGSFVISGATQTSGRLLLAVQDALKKLNQ